MSRQRVTLIAVVLSLPLCACAENALEDFENLGVNLIPNGSFERDGRATLEGWQADNPALASLAHEAAAGGGEWSLRLEADGAPSTGQARFPVPGLRDGDTVRLSAFVRAPTDAGGGRVSLQVKAAVGTLRREASAPSASTRWTQVSVTERLALQAGDTVWVVLSSPPTEIEARAGLFDLVSLERVGSGR